MADPRQRAIIKVCSEHSLAARTKGLVQVFRKYSHSLGPEALDFVEEILERHDIADEQVEQAVEWISEGKARHWKYEKC